MGGVIQGIGSIAGPIISSFLQPNASGTSPAGALASGYLTSQGNKPQGQQYPGAFTPQPGQGLAYNYIPTGQPQMDVGFQNLSAYNTGSGLTAQELANPMAAGLLQNRMNPYGAGGMLQGAGQAGGMLSAAGPGTYAGGEQLQSAILAALPQFQKILQMGTDPQGALYQRTQQQVADQLQAQAAQSGLGGSGVGAGVIGQGVSNFNIDWQNQQLARALSAMQGFGTGIDQLGQGLGMATGQENAGANQVLQGGQLPYLAGQQIYGGQSQALNDYIAQAAGTQGIGDQNLARMLQYLGVGQGANQIAGQAAAGGAATAGAQNAAASGFLSPIISSGISGIGTGLQDLYNYFFGNSGSSIPSGNPLYTGGYSGGLGAGTTPTGADY